jgi:hydrogenase/urease accessory protein HupE
MQLLLQAHQTALSFLDITQDDKNINIIFKKPILDISSIDLLIEYPSSCKDVVPIKRYSTSEYMIRKRVLNCNNEGIDGEFIWINNLTAKDKGVIVKYTDEHNKTQSKLLIANSPFIKINTAQGSKDIAISYLKLGIEHILKGFDHLLFVLGLLLLVKDIRMLIKTITAFTLAHSITLALSVLGYIDISTRYVEAIIALSIVFLAREILSIKNKQEEDRLILSYPWIVAFLFGLLHGIGFASALFGIGLPPDDIPTSLLFFNIGVEIGQLMFISVTLGVIWFFQKITTKYNKISKKITAYLIGFLAMFWFIQRSLLYLQL